MNIISKYFGFLHRGKQLNWPRFNSCTMTGTTMKKLLNIKTIGRYPLPGRGSGSVAKITINRICTEETDLWRCSDDL